MSALPRAAPLASSTSSRHIGAMAHLDIYSDIACPWCFIGKRRLEKALSTLPEAERPTIRWHAYQLQPELPDEGVDAMAYFTKKFGGGPRLQAMFDHVRGVGAAEGIQFAFEGQKACNTRVGHRAVAIARTLGREDAAVEAMFKLHFEKPGSVGNVDDVVQALADAGFDAVSMRAALEAGQGADDVATDVREGRALGVTGVPFFVLDEQIAMSGAQDPETFVAFLAEGNKRAS